MTEFMRERIPYMNWIDAVMNWERAAGAVPATWAECETYKQKFYFCLRAVDTLAGEYGTNPPTLATNASGIKGYLRGLYDRLTGCGKVANFNPRTGTLTGSNKGTKGAVGTAEVVVSATACYVYNVAFDPESETGEVLLLRNAATAGQSVAPVVVKASETWANGAYFPTGLTVCGSHANVSAYVVWGS